MAYGYDKNDIKSIYEYALKAKKKKISDFIEDNEMMNSRDKGAVGNLLQEYYFGIPRNSSPEPDFPDAQLELKVFGYWETKNGGRADQRLALSTIDFMEFEKEVPFEQSHLYKKCHNMLLMAYLMELGKARVDAEIQYVRLYEFEKIVDSDMQQIIRDYYNIAKKIRCGKASELSEGDTEFLGAARTGDKNSRMQKAPGGDKALPRRFAFKQSYMSYLVAEYLIPEKKFSERIPRPRGMYQLCIPRGKSFEEWLDQIDCKYVGKSARKIAAYKKIKAITGKVDFSDRNKSVYSQIGFAMLGIKSNKDAYLIKTNTVVKTVRISRMGVPEESWSFPNFRVEDVPSQEWERSELFEYLSQQRILMQVFVQEGKEYIYRGHLFLKFTPEQLDRYVKDTWNAFKQKIMEGVSFRLEINQNGVRVHTDIAGKVQGQIGLIKLHAPGRTYDIARENIVGETEEAETYIDEHTVDGRFILRPENRKKYGCILPNGDVITKQSFWLNKDFVIDYIRRNKPELLL